MPIFKIQHITKYEYDRPVTESTNEIKIYPFQCSEQETLHHQVDITSNPEIFLYTDYWGNKIGLFNVLQAHQSLVIESQLIIRTTLHENTNFYFPAGLNDLKEEVKCDLQLAGLSNNDDIKFQNQIDDIIMQIQPTGKTVSQIIKDTCEYIYTHFKYIKGITNIESTVDEILAHRSGVCQDFAHVMLQILRSIHIPSRYVSGYICPNKNGMRGEGATHAWVEAYIPGFGWAGIDPTNNVWVTNTHVKLAVGNHFNDCTPAKGTFKGPARQKLSVFVSVGYEDGQVFEEKNNVQMQTIECDAAAEVLLQNTLMGQQQQQQQ